MLSNIPDLPLEELKGKLTVVLSDKARAATASTRLLLEKLDLPVNSVLALTCGAHNLDKVASDTAGYCRG